jgi:hypothetical protein
MTPERVVNRYDLMDLAYDVPLIDVNPRRNQALKEEITAENKRSYLVGHKPAEAIRCRERSTVERVNATFHLGMLGFWRWI